MDAISQDALRLYVVETRERLQQLLQRLHWTEEGVRKVRRDSTLANSKLSFTMFYQRSNIARCRRSSCNQQHSLLSNYLPVAWTAQATVYS